MQFSKILFTAGPLFALMLDMPALEQTDLTRSAATIQTALVAAGSQAAVLQAAFEAATGTADIATITADNDALLASSMLSPRPLLIYLFGFSQMMKQSGMPYYLAEGGFLCLGAMVYAVRSIPGCIRLT